MSGKEGRGEDKRKAENKEGGGVEGKTSAPGPPSKPGALGSLSRGRAQEGTSKPSPKPKKRGKGLLGKVGKEGYSNILSEWLQREAKTEQKVTKGQEGTEREPRKDSKEDGKEGKEGR